MGVYIVAFLIIALFCGRSLGFWLSYKDPVKFIAWVKFCSLALMLAVAGYSLYLWGTTSHLAPVGFLGILYGVLMLLAAGYTIFETVGPKAVEK